jgi:diguanylate cyclase (GGDEF)-like protein
MRLDITTLLIVTFALTFLVGLLFLLSWRQSRDMPALLVWGIAHLAGSVASAGLALRGQIPDAVSIGLSNTVMIAAYGLIWSGIRSFEGRAFRPVATFAGAALWGVLCLVPAFYEAIGARIVVASTIAAIYTSHGALMLWPRGREPLPSRRPAALLLIVYAACYAIRVPATLLAPPTELRSPLDSAWVTVLCLASMLFTLVVAFLFTALAKERAEHRQRVAALTDPLTGVANRRAFFGRAEALTATGGPLTLVLFDLDHFKAINDSFGHGIGDTVLIAFCEVACTLLPPDALFGRLGGEEFGCLLVAREPKAVVAQVECVRQAFAAIRVADLPDLRLRASAGVACGSGIRFDVLMRRADAALYAAKRGGRDRIAVADVALKAA